VAALNKFDIVETRGRLALVVESELLPPDRTVVVIPLLQGYPTIKWLNPEIYVDREPYTLVTRLIGSVGTSTLTVIGSAKAQGDEIARALDMLFYGF
jgi:toxin CcdB